MAVQVIIENDAGDTPWARLPGHLRSIYAKHIAKISCVRVLRTNRGAGSGPVAKRLDVTRDDGQDPETDVEVLVRETMRIIAADATKPRGRNTPNAGQVGEWHGEVVAYSDPEATKALAKIPIELDNPNEDLAVARELEELSIISGIKSFMVAMLGECRQIVGAAAGREAAIAELVSSVAKHTMRADHKMAKWEFKVAREEAETRRHEADARARSTRSRAWADAFETAVEEYRDVVEIWSKYFTRERPDGQRPPPPERPTLDELGKVFADERLQHAVTVRLDGTVTEGATPQRIIAEMIAEPDPRRRMHLAKLLAATVRAWPEELQNLLKLTMVSTLGMARCEEVAAWLSLPIT